MQSVRPPAGRPSAATCCSSNVCARSTPTEQPWEGEDDRRSKSELTPSSPHPLTTQLKVLISKSARLPLVGGGAVHIDCAQQLGNAGNAPQGAGRRGARARMVEGEDTAQFSTRSLWSELGRLWDGCPTLSMQILLGQNWHSSWAS